jgi:uncharacterized membrane protein (UPF0127 family)
MPTNKKKKKRFHRELFFLAFLFAALAYGVMTFNHYQSQEGRLQASFIRSDGSQTTKFNLEIASTPSERKQGLMFRKEGEMSAQEGMIFVFPTEEVQSFWMKNTYISLDMLFVNQEQEVVGILKDVPILNTKPRTVGKPGLYVVELLAGSCEREGIEVGAKLKLHGELPRAL